MQTLRLVILKARPLCVCVIFLRASVVAPKRTVQQPVVLVQPIDSGPAIGKCSPLLHRYVIVASALENKRKEMTLRARNIVACNIGGLGADICVCYKTNNVGSVSAEASCN